MLLTGRTKEQLEEDAIINENKKLADEAQEESEQMLQDILRSMAIDKLKEMDA